MEELYASGRLSWMYVGDYPACHIHMEVLMNVRIALLLVSICSVLAFAGGRRTNDTTGMNGNGTNGSGVENRDTMNGGMYGDTMNGGTYGDTMNGGTHGDTMNGGMGTDTMNGGMNGGWHGDTMNGRSNGGPMNGGSGDTMNIQGTILEVDSVDSTIVLESATGVDTLRYTPETVMKKGTEAMVLRQGAQVKVKYLETEKRALKITATQPNGKNGTYNGSNGTKHNGKKNTTKPPTP
jgi:hypothetical protein